MPSHDPPPLDPLLLARQAASTVDFALEGGERSGASSGIPLDMRMTLRPRRRPSPSEAEAGPEMDEPGSSPVAGPSTIDRRQLPRLELDPEGGGEHDLELRGVLGRGGMGIVHLAFQRSLQREVAIKRLVPRAPGSEDERSHSRQLSALLSEAMFTGFLEHPSIVPVHAVGRDADDEPLMVMKRVEGVPWVTLIHSPRHPFWDRVRGERWIWHVQLCMQLCRALEYAHSRGVLHRDVKPENVIVGEFGEVVLLDWGVAVRIEQTADLPADHIAGTPAFMAPEMLSPERGEIGPATDVYLLGASLHHALVGRPPHHHDSLVATFTSVAESAPPEYGPEIERELARILRRAMDRDPSARFEGPAELREALEDALRHRASVQLTTEAIRRLEAMEAELEGPAPNPGTIREHFETARFGLEQALEGWPENLEAQLQLAQALERMATLEIASRHTGAARALLRSLESCAEPAAERIRAMLLQLEAEVEAEQAEQSRLRRLELELDPGVSRAQRRVAAGALGGAAIVGASALLITDALGLVEISALGLVGIALAALMASSLGLFLFRHFFFRNRINRVMSGFLVFLLLGLLGHRLHGLSIDQPVWQILAGDGILIATVSALAGVVLHLRFFLPAILMGAGAAAASSWHERAFTLIALAGIASIASILLWRPDVGTVEEKR